MSKQNRVVLWLAACFLIGMLCFAIAHPVSSDIPKLNMLLDGDSVTVLNDTQTDIRHSEDSAFLPDAIVLYEAKREGVPINGVLEFFVRRSILDDPIMYPIGLESLSESQRQQITEAAINYARFDRSLRDMSPGEPPETRFSFVRSFLTMVRLFVIASCATMILLIVDTLYSRLGKRQSDPA